MGYGERSRLARFSGAPINGAELELKQERERARPRLAEYECPKCGSKASAPHAYGAAVCEPALDPETMEDAVARGGRVEEIKSRKGCGWLLRLEPFGDVLTADDVAYVGPWRPSRMAVIQAMMPKIIENWQRRGVGPPALRKASQWRDKAAIEVRISEVKHGGGQPGPADDGLDHAAGSTAPPEANPATAPETSDPTA